MRLMLLVEIDTDAGNRAIEEHRMEKVMEEVLGQLRPEAAYFYPRGGKRALTLVVDAADDASIPSLVEPFWLHLNANVEVIPCMNAEDLRTGLGRLV